MADGDIPIVEPKEALAFFRAKGLAKAFAWQDVFKEQHDWFFTVAKMMKVSLLEDTRAIIDAGIEAGTSPQQMRRELKEKLIEAGWWGKKRQIDPATGQADLVQLGSDKRVRTIINTNLRTSYAAGRAQRVERVKSAFPILVYKAVLDGRERDEHRAWHNVALPVGDAWWDSHTPPCDWGCRCRTVSMTKGQAARRNLDATKRPQDFGSRQVVNRRTGEVSTVENGIGFGWDYNPGKSRIDGIAPPPLSHFSSLDREAVASSEDAYADFLDPFGLGPDGGHYIDAAGWPLPVSARWLRGLSRKAMARREDLAATITNPDQIRLVWVVGNDERLMLFRRYVRIVGGKRHIADFHATAWRFGIFGGGKREAGVLAWTKPGV